MFLLNSDLFLFLLNTSFSQRSLPREEEEEEEEEEKATEAEDAEEETT